MPRRPLTGKWQLAILAAATDEWQDLRHLIAYHGLHEWQGVQRAARELAERGQIEHHYRSTKIRTPPPGNAS